MLSINFSSNVIINFDWIQKRFLKSITARQGVIAVIALAAISCLAGVVDGKEKGVRIFGVNSLSKLSKQIYKEPIRKIAQEIYAFNDFKVRIR
jgi:hypothetical protein